MKIIVDPLKQLNYHPTRVYFMLSPKDYYQYGEKLKQLNRFMGVTRGLFKFQAIPRGKCCFQDLTEELKHALRSANIIVRLMDDADRNFNYALGKIDISQDPDLWEEQLRKFVVNVCKHNIGNLLSQSHGGGTEMEMGYEYVELINGFEKALALKKYRQGVWRDILDPQPIPLRVMHACKLPTHIKNLSDSIYDRLPTSTARDDFRRMMKYFEEVMETSTPKKSDSYAQGAIDPAYADSLSDDYRSRVRKFDKPDITIAIKKVVSGVRKYKVKQGWGIEINIKGDIVPVYIGSTAAAMVYICTLLRQKMGEKLYRDVFRKPLLGNRGCLKRDKDLLWLEQVYYKLFPGASIDFDEWYEKMKGESCRFINQGKSASVRIVNSCLKDYPEAVYYCCVQKGQTDKRESFYYFDVPNESIVVPDEFEELLSGQ